MKKLKVSEPPDIGEESVEDDETTIKSKNGKKLTRLEKSKVAAKSRRDREAIEFQSLTELLPLPADTIKKLDKTSIIKLIISYMTIKNFTSKQIAYAVQQAKNGNVLAVKSPATNRVTQQLALQQTPATDNELNSDRLKADDKTENNDSKSVSCDTTHIKKKLDFSKAIALPGVQQLAEALGIVDESEMMLTALDGFIIVLDRRKTVIYVSENVEDFLGFPQARIIGNSIKDFIHPSDIPELKKQFNLRASSCSGTGEFISHTDLKNGNVPWPNLDNNRLFYLRMKYNLLKAGMKTRQIGHTLVQWSGKLKMTQRVSNIKTQVVECVICVCHPMQASSILEIRMDGNMFMSRHDLGMRFTFCDSRIITLIGYEPKDVIGKTAYQFHNPLDAQRVGDCHSNLIVKGTSVSKYYRFIGKSCDWVWMQTRATIIYNTSNAPQYIVCMNYIISEEEGRRFIMMEEEKHNHITGQAPGVMDLSLTPCEGSKTPSHAHGSPGDHSDMGYCSANSPYSSVNPSPSSHCNMEEDHGITITDTENDFSVLREVADTMNEAHDETTILDLIDSLNKETPIQQLDPGIKSSALPNNEQSLPATSPWISDQTGSQEQVFSGTSAVSSPQYIASETLNQSYISEGLSSYTPVSDNRSQNTFVTTATSGLSLNQNDVMDIGLSMPTATSSFQMPDPVLPASTWTGQMSEPQMCSQLSPPESYSSVYSSPSIATSPVMMSISEDSNQSIGTDVSFTATSPSINKDPQQHSPLSCTDGQVSSDALFYGQTDLLMSDSSEKSKASEQSDNILSDCLPRELTDFCVQFYNSVAAKQGQQILEEFRQGEIISSLEELEKQNTQGSYSKQLLERQISSERRYNYSNASAGSSAVYNSPNQDQLVPVKSFPVQNQEHLMSQKNGGILVVSDRHPVPTTSSHSHRPPSAPGMRTSRSVPASLCSCSNTQQYHGYSNVPQNNARISPVYSTTPRLHFSQGQGHSNLGRSHEHYYRASNPALNHIGKTNGNMQHSASAMSELEKILRDHPTKKGVHELHQNPPSNQHQFKVPQKTVSNSHEEGGTLLSQMLTGRLSGECYHAMEMRRQAQKCLRNDQQ